MKALGVIILIGLCGFLSYGIWSSQNATTGASLFLNQEYLSSAEEVITWKPLESSLNLTEIPYWSELSDVTGAKGILNRLNSKLSGLGLTGELTIRIFIKEKACSFLFLGDAPELEQLAMAFFDTKDVAQESLKSADCIGKFDRNRMLICSSQSVFDTILENSKESAQMLHFDDESTLSWYSQHNVKKWFAYDEISAEGSATVRFKKRKGFVYAYAFVQDSTMTSKSIDLNYSIWDFQVPGNVTKFTVEEFPIRKLDAEILTEIEGVCQCDVRTAWKSWNTHQVYLFNLRGIEFYGLQCLDDIPAKTGMYPFIADKAEMYKGYEIKSLISGAEVGGLYADMFGREVSHFLDLEKQVFFFSSISEAKSFVNGIQTNRFELLVDEGLQELLLLSPNYTAFNSNGSGDIPVVYQFEKQDKGRYYHALWKAEGDIDLTSSDSGVNSDQLQNPSGNHKTKWEKQMSAEVIKKPFVFTNHYTREKEVVICTGDNKITLLDVQGQVVWERQLDEPISGVLHQVDLFRNNKFQLVFSTKNQLYAIDRNGKNVENFPVRLPAESSAAVSVMDYDGKRKYRMLVPLVDGSLLNYNKDGKQVNGWKHKKESTPILSQVHHLEAGKRDYLISIKKDGKIAIYKRDGKLRHSQELRLENYVGGELKVIPASKIEEVVVIYSDSSGSIVKSKLSLDNNKAQLLEIAIGNHSLVEQLVDGVPPDYLVSKDQRLTLYNENAELKFTTEFTSAVSSELHYFIKGKRKYLGVVSGSDLHLLNTRGETVSGFPVYGEKSFSIADLNRDGTYELITSDNQGLVICYGIGQM